MRSPRRRTSRIRIRANSAVPTTSISRPACTRAGRFSRSSRRPTPKTEACGPRSYGIIPAARRYAAGSSAGDSRIASQVSPGSAPKARFEARARRMAGWRGLGAKRRVCALALSCLFSPISFAQIAPGPAASAGSAAAASDPKARELADRRTELRGLEETIDAAEARQRKIEADLEGVRTDRARLSAALIETTGKIRQAEARV